MRVIAGLYRSRLLTAPRGVDTRPTSDRLRETLFNVLAPRLPGASFLDLYAGSGANGIEALSRGASRAIFVENASPALAAIRSNLSALGIGAGAVVEPRSAAAFLRRAAQASVQASAPLCDIVFLDPPWDNAENYGVTLELLGGAAQTLLAPGGVVVAEHRRRQSPAASYGTLIRTRLLEQGDAALSFYAVAEKEP